MKQNQSKHAAPIETSINGTSATSYSTAEEVHRATSMPEASPIMASTQAPAKSSNSADAIMGGRSNVLSHQQLLDVNYALKKVKSGSGIWPFPKLGTVHPPVPSLETQAQKTRQSILVSQFYFLCLLWSFPRGSKVAHVQNSDTSTVEVFRMGIQNLVGLSGWTSRMLG